MMKLCKRNHNRAVSKQFKDMAIGSSETEGLRVSFTI